MQSLGVSVNFIQGFIKEHLTKSVKPEYQPVPPKTSEKPKTAASQPSLPEEFIKMNMFELCEKIIKPQTAAKQLRFVELHHGKVGSKESWLNLT